MSEAWHGRILAWTDPGMTDLYTPVHAPLLYTPGYTLYCMSVSALVGLLAHTVVRNGRGAQK